MRLRSFLGAAALVCAAAAAHAASIPLLQGPTEPPTLVGPLNTLINQINQILSPLTGGPQINGNQPGQPATATNTFQFIPAVSGSLALIALQSGSDPNASIGIDPPGTGNIVLFPVPSLVPNQSQTMLQFGNPGAFIRANGFSPCPGMAVNRPPMLNVAAVVSGFFMTADWLGNQYAVPVCGNTNTPNGQQVNTYSGAH